MSELPEVENVRRTLQRRVVGVRVAEVEVRRADVITGEATPAALLAGDRVARIERHGKQLALLGEGGRAVCVHLGMTGSLVARDAGEPTTHPNHEHVHWRFAGGATLTFRDPRRFGGLWTFASEAELRGTRWAELGTDATVIQPHALAAVLSRKRLALKAALLDQAVVAGLGNIYVDELLFARGLHPLTPAGGLDGKQVAGLVRAMRRLLERAVAAGGSTLRDYVNGDGAAGGFQDRHRVYGRGGEPCRRCRAALQVLAVAGRTTTFCGRCQPLRGREYPGVAIPGAGPGEGGDRGASSSRRRRESISSSP